MSPRLIPPDTMKLMRFVAKKARNAKAPMNMQEMCRKFKKETRSLVSAHSLCCRIDKNRERIPEMDEFDVDTRARMMLAVSAKVDPNFLIELRKHAHVEVDDFQRIVRYEKRESSRRFDEPSTAKRRRDSEMSTSGRRQLLRAALEFSEDDEMDIPENDFRPMKRAKFEQKAEPAQEIDRIVKQEPSEDSVQVDRYEKKNQEIRTIVRPDPETASTSVRDLLILFRGTLFTLESRHLNGLRRKIDSKIEKLSNEGDRQIPLGTIHLAFDPCLFLLMTHAAPKSEDESTSLRRFMCFLQAATCHLVHPSMSRFHQKMKAFLDELDVKDKRIPIKIVHSALDATITIIDP